MGSRTLNRSIRVSVAELHFMDALQGLISLFLTYLSTLQCHALFPITLYSIRTILFVTISMRLLYVLYS